MSNPPRTESSQPLKTTVAVSKPPADTPPVSPEISIAEDAPTVHVEPQSSAPVTHDGVTDPRDADFDALFRESQAGDQFDEVSPVELEASQQEREAHESELVPIVPRVNMSRIRVGKEWFNLRKGQEQFVTRANATWFRERDLV